MMDITKSREEFEAWLKSKIPTTYRLAFECGDDGELTNLAKASVLDMRTAWQASRESIEVEFPDQRDENFDTDTAYNEGLSATANALRTAGIRIKGESE
ncbi:hypothetical protein PL78_19220 [Yersinia entomophaga]|uniref:Phage protein n=1 Tax=Yersinia entomophaga TaxID=935293 RepID=A0ABM6BRJ1_YERET|nr:hypothetical protein [Yersinia entomophaga]ANI31945.1 hypothetical protein PL78_19220 [Yersinia entomophaga]OWF84484.1 hypothetical protein B4914_19035 [Yersinia entomophaga]